MRAHCDAVEIARLLLDSVLAQLDAADRAQWLRVLQDPVSGLVPELAQRVAARSAADGPGRG